MNKKIAAFISAIGIASSGGVVALDQQCAFDKVVIEVPQSNVRICFKKEDDYKIYKKETLKKFKENAGKSRPEDFGYFDTMEEYQTFIAFLDKEFQGGTLTEDDLISNEALRKKLMSL